MLQGAWGARGSLRPCFHFLWDVRSGALTGLHGGSVFNFLRLIHTLFHRGCPGLRSHQPRTRVSLSPHPLANSRLSLDDPVITGATRWLLVLICVSLTVREAEQLSRHLLPICVSPLEICFIQYLCLLFICFFFLFLLDIRASFDDLWMSPRLQAALFFCFPLPWGGFLVCCCPVYSGFHCLCLFLGVKSKSALL